ncbi:WD40 repeat domain-containing protein [Tundrisphaera lichenicola]|uniref:WD40 repeat domain-containing protein n=1 Tax=Tundrisphaera lichenicola TaxID=2029860 RepID=UPI003EBEB7A7
MLENTEALKVTREISRKEIVFGMARVTGSQRVLFGGSDFQVYDVDLAAEKSEPKSLGAHESYVTGLAVAGKHLVSGGYDGKLIWWDLESGSKIRTVDAHSKWIRRVVATPDGSTIASVADDMACRLWDAETGSIRHELKGHQEITPHHYPSMLHSCAISPDGAHVATGDKLGHIVVWEIASGKSVATMEAPVMYTWDPVQRRHSIGGIRALAFSPDGNSLAVGGIGKIGNIDHLEGLARLEVFDWKKGERTFELNVDGTKGIFERLLYFPDGGRLAGLGGANDGFLMIFDLKGKAVAVNQKAPAHLYDGSFGDSPDLLLAVGYHRVAAYEIKV